MAASFVVMCEQSEAVFGMTVRAETRSTKCWKSNAPPTESL